MPEVPLKMLVETGITRWLHTNNKKKKDDGETMPRSKHVMPKRKLGEGDYYDSEKGVFIIYFPCKRLTLPTDLCIIDTHALGESEPVMEWNCYLKSVSLVNARAKNKDYIQLYKCTYKKY